MPTIKEDTSGCNIATVNPFRYRGYYYDAETNLYYLQSRYYDVSLGRYLSADDPDMLSPSGYVLDANLFAYCINNPIMHSDYSGKLAQAIIGAIVSGVIALGLYYLEYYLGMRRWNWFAMVAIVGANAAMGAFLWYLGLGGRFQNMLKLIGIAQKMRISNSVIKGLILLAKGFNFLINMVMKVGSRKNGESWFTAIKRFFKKGLGVSI